VGSRTRPIGCRSGCSIQIRRWVSAVRERTTGCAMRIGPARVLCVRTSCISCVVLPIPPKRIGSFPIPSREMPLGIPYCGIHGGAQGDETPFGEGGGPYQAGCAPDVHEGPPRSAAHEAPGSKGSGYVSLASHCSIPHAHAFFIGGWPVACRQMTWHCTPKVERL